MRNLIIKRKYTLNTFRKSAKASGEDEADYVPNFGRFFFDEEGHASAVFEPEIFFVLGRKGTGKSLLARYVAQRASESTEAYRKIVEVQSFRNFAFYKLTPFKQELFKNKEYFAIWRWVLWLTIARQLVKDETITPSKELERLKKLIFEQFQHTASPSEVVERTNSLKISGGFKDYLSMEHRSEQRERPKESIDDANSIEELIIAAFRLSSMEVVVFFDDLDDGFEDTELYEQSLGSLIYAVDHVNRKLSRSGIKAKIVLLLRTDIFRAINTSDLNKFKTGNAILLDWNIEERENSPLVRLLVHRLITALGVSISHTAYAEAFYELFEDPIEGRRTASWIVDLSLGRPRDLVQLTNLACEACPTHPLFTALSLRQARPKFSQFLYDDIRNEMKGHQSREFIDGALSLLKGVPVKGTFTISKLREKKPHLFGDAESEQKIRDYLAFLYRFSAIGNLYHNPDDPTQVANFAWAHREDQPEPDFDAALTVHHGLRHALKAGIENG